MKTYRFIGTDSRDFSEYEAEADTLVKLYEELENNGTISNVDGSPYYEAILKKYKKTWDDFDNDWEKLQEWIDSFDPSLGLTDYEIVELIYSENINVYYRRIEVFDGKEYGKIEG